MQKTGLIGVWTLVSFVITNENGEVVNTPLGLNPSGNIIYTSDGYMSANMASANRPHFLQEIFNQAKAKEKIPAADSYIGYSGTYDLQEDHIIHHVKVSLFPNWTDGDLVRLVDLNDDRLILSAPMQFKGATWTLRLTWHRA